jgi:predicted enzyme related to lactoylglutathione lyase
MSDVKVNWFEIPVADVERSQSFYEALLERELGEIDGPDGKMRVFMSENGPEGTISKSDRVPGADGVLIYLHCPDIDGALSRCGRAGGKIEEGKRSIGPFGHIAVIRDPDGNRIGLHFGG